MQLLAWHDAADLAGFALIVSSYVTADSRLQQPLAASPTS
jgi:hypothetical protein